jgi:RHS repeat-associated protein
VQYAYYGASESHGNKGDLKTATIQDGSGNNLDTEYYRYYTGEPGGYPDALKYYFDSASYARLKAVYSDPTTATDAQAAPYAVNYFEYDSIKRVTKAIVQAAGSSSSSGGLGTYSFSYGGSTNTNGYNSWLVKTVETLPDGNTNTVYTNYAGEVMLKVYHDATSGLNWEWFTQYDGSGRVLMQAGPAAVTGYNDTYADLLHFSNGSYQYLSNTTGLITKTDYYTSTTAGETTAGGVAGYTQDDKVQRGQTGGAITLDSIQYFQHTANGSSVDPVANTTAYRNTDGTGGETTSYAYTWFSGTTQMQSEAVSAPTISSTQNGPGTADTTTTFFDTYERPIWTKDPDGFLHYTAYDPVTGAVVKTITDVDTTKTGDFQNLPSGWSTPSGGGLHLITALVVDALGRPTQITDPLGNVTYQVFIDTNHEERIYPGWNTSTNMPTGPTQDYRVDRTNSYIEELTMSATPHLTGGVPDGTEAVSGVQTLSRQYISSGGQDTADDKYFNLSGVTYSTSPHIGTLNTNYYETSYGYDSRGRLSTTTLPTNTVETISRDGLGRVTSTAVGTTTLSSVTTANYVYDNNTLGGSTQVGDGNLTQIIEHPGGSAPDRVTEQYYDWRDRLVATKEGVQSSEDTTTHRSIIYYTYDNLDEVTEVQQFDGDGVTITSTNGVPNAPSASLLRAETITSYDDQQRVYKTQTYSVDPSTGAVSTNALTTQLYYNHRGQLIETRNPGLGEPGASATGVVDKSQYDGAGRETISFVTDGSGGTSWSAAGSVTGDNVLSQIETTYDGDGNPILVTDRERNHDETATGALGNETTTPKARVYSSTSYYDQANRVTATVDVGTNGGTAYTRPSSVPTASDTVLVTLLGYSSAGWVKSITDPRGIVEQKSYDNLGQVTQTIEDYTNGTPTATTNKTTNFTYDGDGHMLTLQAVEPGGASQTTKWIYGVSTTGGSDVNSNDILATVQYPDPSAGSPSSSYQETYTSNALGQTKTYTDRAGNVHTYTLDILGRVTKDAITTLATGSDGSIRRIETAYDTQGNPYLITSYDSPTGGNIVNQVQRAYNGLGQLSQEWQSHSGAVNTNTTPNVQYGYTLMSGGVNNSRLTSMTYPNGKVLNYNYGTAGGLNDTISRLDSLSDSSGTLEQYTYLGLDTVVKRAHPQPGVDLTYIKQSGESNGDAGDQYTGLDRFGRVVDQRWINTGTNTATDRFQYGYDRDSNALYRNNLVNTAFGELYHASGAGNGYDNLNQLSGFLRGVLSASQQNGPLDTISNPSTTESWSPDALGNFSSITTNGTTQTRTANQQNEITSISGATTPIYDTNGNLTTDELGQAYKYDAWNRLVQVKNSAGTVIASYAYDGLGRRIQETHSGTVNDLYYSSAWQVLEERTGGVSTATIQYVWSPVYVDTLVLRDRSTQNNGTLDERLWVQQDANWNVTALVNGAGAVVERYIHDPYGQVTYLNASWSTISSSAYAWIYGFQGLRADTATGNLSARHRDYRPTLQRWLQLDPIGIGGGDTNFFRTEGDNPTDNVDPTGLDSGKGFADYLYDFGDGLCEPVRVFGDACRAGWQGLTVAGYYVGLTNEPYEYEPHSWLLQGLENARKNGYKGSYDNEAIGHYTYDRMVSVMGLGIYDMYQAFEEGRQTGDWTNFYRGAGMLAFFKIAGAVSGKGSTGPANGLEGPIGPVVPPGRPLPAWLRPPSDLGPGKLPPPPIQGEPWHPPMSPN